MGPSNLDGVEHSVQSLVRSLCAVDTQSELFLSVAVEDFHLVLADLHLAHL